MAARIFVPGFGARAGFYRAALGGRWTVHEPPSFRSGAAFEAHVAAFESRLAAAREPVVVAGHSLGAAVALVAATRLPEAVERLLLIAPAGLPLTKPITASARDFRRQFAEGDYPNGELTRALGSILGAPRA